MLRWRTARDTGVAFAESEQRELEALIDAELRAAVARTTLVSQEQRA
jgi:hypothetical protein